MKINNKAFTLIELMIVVVILGVLMSTILPKLTGAQARSRDAARVADISNISSALGVYYDDNGKFATGAECLGDTGGIVTSQLVQYIQNNIMPVDQQPTSNSHLCKGKLGRYYYRSLTKDGLDDNAYILCADVETYQKSNTDAGNLTKSDGDPSGEGPQVVADQGDVSQTTGGNDYNDAAVNVGRLTTNAQKLAADAKSNQSVYCILRP